MVIARPGRPGRAITFAYSFFQTFFTSYSSAW